MSARAPFFPSGARQQESMADDDRPEVVKSHFPADKCNPLHSDAQADIDASTMKGEKSTLHDADNKLTAESNTNDARNKPLNVSGLIRSRTHSKPPQRVPVNSANGNNIVRPGTADPTRNIQSFDAHTITIAAPTPFKASKMAPSLLMSTSNPDISPRDPSSFNFKAPLPHVLTNDDLFANNAHIPIETRNSLHTADVSGHPRALNSLGNRSVSSRMLDRNGIEDATHATNGLGPQHNLNGVKRRKLEPEVNGRSEQHQKHSKRSKESHLARNNTRIEGNEQEHIHSRTADRVSDYRYPENMPLDSNEIRPNIDAFPYPDTGIVKMGQQAHSIGLDRLLGCEVNAYVEDRLIEKYEQAISRWRESSMDQWLAGADEIMAKYSKILDFVKDHINAKIALYASCANKIDQHGDDLTKREEILSGLKARLVKESESILGRSLGM